MGRAGRSGVTLLVPDVNILVYAFRADTDEHPTYLDWLHRALVEERVGLADTILSGFVRVVTHPRVFSPPASVRSAVEFVAQVSEAPGATWISQGPTAWSRFAQIIASDHGIRGNLVPDAHIAALCIANGATLATRDRGFARFEGLRWFDPARG